MIKALAPFNLAWFEEPLAKGALEDYRKLREKTGVRVMLDESLCSPEDATSAITEKSCDLFNIRLSKHGGFIAGLRLAELARKHGLGYQLGTHPGSQGVLRAAEWKFANTIKGFAAVEAARTNAWVKDELIAEELVVGPVRLVPLEGPGWGCRVLEQRLRDGSIDVREWSPSQGWSAETA